jgi:Mn-dependent DtxR family transcriptional regulator
MPEGMNELKVRILICLLAMKDFSSSVTHLSGIFNVAKSTISRAVTWCEQRNLLERVNNGERQIKLSDYGMQLAKEYERRRELSQAWLVAQGIPREVAENDALVLAIGLSKQGTAAFEQSVKQRLMKQHFDGMRHFDGNAFCEALDDGSYPISFVFYRCDCKANCMVSPSMANDGFESSGELIVKKGNGMILLKAKPLEHTSALGGFRIRGSLHAMKYRDGAKFKEARKEGDSFYFPASVLKFLNVNCNQFFQGSVVLRMSCSAGKIHMPESNAIFTMYF